MRRNKIQTSYIGISAARYLSTKHIDSVESQDENVTKLYSQHIDKLSETSTVPPMDKSNIGSPEIVEDIPAIPEPPMSKMAEILQVCIKHIVIILINIPV